MTTVTFSIPNISCHHCAHTIKTEVGEMSGVESVDVTVDAKTATISFESPASEEEIRAFLAEINYPAE